MVFRIDRFRRSFKIAALWLLCAMAGVFLLVQIIALVQLVASRGQPVKWQVRHGIVTYGCTVNFGEVEFARLIQPPCFARPNETLLGSQTSVWSNNVDFIVGEWVHGCIDAFFSPIPNDTWDWAKTSTYRYAVCEDVKALVLGPWACLLIFALLAALPVKVLTVRWRNHILERRRLILGRCRTCGYDLRASPDRCPECGMIADHSPQSSPARLP